VDVEGVAAGGGERAGLDVFLFDLFGPVGRGEDAVAGVAPDDSGRPRGFVVLFVGVFVGRVAGSVVLRDQVEVEPDTALRHEAGEPVELDDGVTVRPGIAGEGDSRLHDGSVTGFGVEGLR
jgi:hypothetical protein